MAEDDRPTDAGKLKRRGKAPTLTLEATDITPAVEAPADPLPGGAWPAMEPTAPEAAAEPATGASGASSGGSDEAVAVASDAGGPGASAETAPPAEASSPTEAPSPEAPGPAGADGPATSRGDASAGDTAADAPLLPPAEAAPPAPDEARRHPDPEPAGLSGSPATGDAAAARPEPSRASEPPPSMPVPLPAGRSGPGFGALIAAGLVGALLTAGLAFGAAQFGYFSPPPADTSALETRLAALDRRIGEVAARPAPVAPPVAGATGAPLDIAPLTQRLETLDTARAALEARIAALESRPQPEPAAAPPPAAAPAPVDLDPVNREIEALKAALGRVEEAQRSVAAAPAPSPAPTGPDMAAVTAAIDERLREAVATEARRAEAIEGRVTQLSTEIARQAEALEGRVTALTGDLGKQAAATEAATQRLATLDQARALGERSARLVGIEVLRASVDRGGAYAAELRGALALGVDADALAPLSASAERGVPTRAAVHRGFAGLAPQLVRAAPTGGEGGFFDRLASNAQGLVRVRPVGEAAGDSVPAVVARIEAKLGRGDLAGALADFDALPEPVKAPAQDWLVGARARFVADRALAKVSAEALAALPAR